MPAVNGKDILSAVITEPRTGLWTAELDCDSESALSGKVTIEVDDEKWIGTVMRGDTDNGRAHAFVVGGAGGLGQPIDAKFYVGAPLGTVLRDIARATGETIAASSDVAVLTKIVPRWTRSQAIAAQALRQVAEEAGVSWRMLRDGTIWIGKESWPAATLKDYDETSRAPGRGSITVAPNGAPTLRPATTFQGKRVSSVTTHVRAAGVRQEVLLDDDDEDDDGQGAGRVMSDFLAIIEMHIGNRLDYARWYPARVIAQAADDSLELLVDHPKMRGSGLTKVPIMHGIPGVRVKVNAGSRVRLYFEDGDPKQPAAALWPDGSSCSEISIKAPKVTIDGDLFVTGEVTAMTATPATTVALSTHLHPTAMGPSSPPTPGT